MDIMSKYYNHHPIYTIKDEWLSKRKEWETVRKWTDRINSDFRAEYVAVCGKIKWDQILTRSSTRTSYYWWDIPVVFLLFKIVSFVPARFEKPLFGTARFFPPTVIVQDQWGRQFELLECQKREEFGESCMGLIFSKRVYALIDEHLAESACEMVGSVGSWQLEHTLCNRAKAAELLEEWESRKPNLGLELERMRKEWIEVRRKNEEEKRKEQNKLNRLDGMFH